MFNLRGVQSLGKKRSVICDTATKNYKSMKDQNVSRNKLRVILEDKDVVYKSKLYASGFIINSMSL